MTIGSRTSLCLVMLCACIALAAPSSAGSGGGDRVETIPAALFLAKEYRLYDDAEKMLEGVTDATLRNVALARVKIVHAGHIAASGGDEAKRKTLLVAARGLLQQEAQKDRLAGLEFGRLLIDVVDAEGGSTADKRAKLDQARAYLDNEFFPAVYSEVQAKFDYHTNEDGSASDLYTAFMGGYYERARVRLMQARLEPLGASSRTDLLKSAGKILAELKFDKVPEQFIDIVIDAYLLHGEVVRTEGDPKGAVDKYLDLVETMAGADKRHPFVRFTALRAFLKAVETLLSDLPNDPEAVKQARNLIARALRDYPQAASEEQGKELRMYDISARVLQGESVSAMLDDLFRFVSDASPEFRNKAARQLARIAQNKDLTNEQRLECIKRVRASGDYELNLLAVQALHAILANLNDQKQFEAYGPFCYLLLGQTFESIGRYLDAAITYREAANRVEYFSTAFKEGSQTKLPGHFFGKDGQPFCESGDRPLVRLMTEDDASKLPKAFAERALTNARWLQNENGGGDKSNREFDSFIKDMDNWFNRFRGEDERYKALTTKGFEQFNKQSWASAAQYLLSTRKRGPLLTACYFAGTALISAMDAPGQPGSGPIAPAAFWLTGYQLDGLECEAQLARIDTELDGLPQHLRDELKAEIAAFTAKDRGADVRKDLWLMAIFAFKRGMLSEAVKKIDEIREAGTDTGKASAAELIAAYAALLNRELLAQPDAARKANPTAILLGKCCIQLAYTLRSPRLSIANPSEAKKAQDALAASRLDEAHAYLAMGLDAFGAQFDAQAKNGDNDNDRKEGETLKRSLLTLRFRVFVEQRLAPEALGDFEIFRREFGNKGDDKAKEETRTQMRGMLSQLLGVLGASEQPKVSALKKARERIDNFRVLLSKDHTTQLARARYNKRRDEEAKSNPLPEWNALSESARREEIAAYIAGELIHDVFGPEASFPVEKGGSRLLSAGLPATELAEFEAAFEEMKRRYNGIWRDTVIHVLDTLKDHNEAKPIEKEIEAALELARKAGPDAAFEHLQKLADPLQGKTGEDGKRASALYFVLDQAREAGRANSWIEGNAFIGEFMRWLDGRSMRYREMARKPSASWLKVALLNGEMSGKPLYNASNAKEYAVLFTDVDDWANGYAAWSTYFESVKQGYGDPSFIDLDASRKMFANTANEDEIETRYQLALCALRMADSASGAERAKYLDEALKHLRRCYNFALLLANVGLRDELKNSWRVNLEDSGIGRRLAAYYLPIMTAYSEALRRHTEEGLKPKWDIKYYDQQGRDTPVKRDNVFYKLPETPAELLAEASFPLFQIWSGYQSYSGGIYRDDYRDAMMAWTALKLPLAATLEKSGDKAQALKERAFAARQLDSVLLALGDGAHDPATVEFKGKIATQLDAFLAILGEEWAKGNLPSRTGEKTPG